MSQKTRFRIEPTFPLDLQRIQSRMWRVAFRSPGRALTLFGTYLHSCISRWQAEGTTRGAAADRRLSLWELKCAELESEAIQELIGESNAAQDAELDRIIAVLASQGFHQYSTCLGKFQLLKQRIEGELHEDGRLTRKKTEIEKLVDALCRGICDEISSLTEIESQLADVLTSRDSARLEFVASRRQECHQRLQHAYTTVFETAQRLGMMLRPGAATPMTTHEETRILDRLIEQLREENEIARRVHSQLTDDALRSNRSSDDPD